MKLKLFHDIFDRRVRPLETLEYLAETEGAAEHWHELGMAYFQRLKFHLAAEAFDRALQLAPQNPEVHFHRGITLSIMGKFGQAIEDFSEVLRHQPNHFAALYNRGRLLARLRRYEEAIADFRRAMQLDPTRAKELNVPTAVRTMQRRLEGRPERWWDRLRDLVNR